MKCYKQGNKIIIEIPWWSKRFNPYMPNEDVGEYPTLTGIITKDKFGNDKLGFAKTIDMAYKDKADQVTDIMIHYCDDKKKFIELCEELKIEIFEYPICDYCEQPIYGCFTFGEKGNMCHECEQKKFK